MVAMDAPGYCAAVFERREKPEDHLMVDWPPRRAARTEISGL